VGGVRNDSLLRAARRERTGRTPVWLMRQAGRTDPKYIELRERVDLPLEALFRQPDLAAEISLLPKRLGVDAIILFQDILTPLAPMGAEFVFRPGPVLDSPIRSSRDVAELRGYDVGDELGFVSETLRLVRTALHGELPLLGFAGAPLTLALFLIEGRSPGQRVASRRTPGRLRGHGDRRVARPRLRGHKDGETEGTHTSAPAAPGAQARAFMRDDPAAFHRLLDKLADMTVDYLALQIEAGADAVQLFESFADLLSPEEYEEFAHPYHVRIFSELAARVPTILYAKEQPRVELLADSGADVLSVGTCVDLADAFRRFGHKVAFQGNVDNHLVAEGSLEEIDQAVRRCIAAGGHRGHILNLSHGLLQETPFENVRRFIETAKATLVPESSQAVGA
jgi:uroporphyrinogen decarboxylase